MGRRGPKDIYGSGGETNGFDFYWREGESKVEED